MRTILHGSIIPKTTIFFPEDEHGSGGGGGNEEVEKKPANLKEFVGRFAASKANPMMVGGVPTEQQIKDATPKPEKTIEERNEEQHEGESPEEKQQREAQEQERARHRRPGENIKKVIEDKRKAEQERDAVKTEFETFKAEKEGKIAELQKKIDGGELSSTKEAEYTKRIGEMEQQILDEKAALVNDNKRLKERLSYFDLAEDDAFKAQYLKPVVESYNEIENIIGADDAKMEILGRALIANSAALQSNNKENKLRAQRERDNLLSQVQDGLDGFSATRFATAMGEYIRKTENHAKALINHTETAAQMREEMKGQRDQQYAKTLKTWGSTYDTTEAAFKEDATLSAEEIEVAKELKLNVDADLKANGDLGKKIVTGQGSMVDSVRMVHQGRLYPALKARIAIRDKQLADAQALIAKLRKGSTGGGGSSQERKEEPKVGVIGKDGDKMDRRKWQESKFGANRPGLVRRDASGS